MGLTFATLTPIVFQQRSYTEAALKGLWSRLGKTGSSNRWGTFLGSIRGPGSCLANRVCERIRAHERQGVQCGGQARNRVQATATRTTFVSTQIWSPGVGVFHSVASMSGPKRSAAQAWPSAATAAAVQGSGRVPG